MRRSLLSSFSSSSSAANSCKKRIVIALSGGVDSSVVAHLMKQKFGTGDNNNNLTAIYMSNWEPRDEDDDGDEVCPNSQDWKDAQKVALHLGLPIRQTQFQSEYWTQVFEPYVESVARGKRLNPDVDCNRYIKFGALRDYIHNHLSGDSNDTILATGHYARLWYRGDNPYYDKDYDDENKNIEMLIEEMIQEGIDNKPNNQQQQSYDWIRNWGSETTALCPLLLSARDTTKCQTLFLSGVPGTAFQNVVFPLGNLYKTNSNSANENLMTVREIAKLANLPTAAKRDSMGICFIGKRRKQKGGFNTFMNQYLDLEGGEGEESFQFVDIDTGEIIQQKGGKVAAKQRLYTKGQGAKISGASQPWFVSDVDIPNKTIWVCNDTHHPSLYTNVFYIRAMNWIAGTAPTPMVSQTTTSTSNTLYAKCRIRNLQPLVDCIVTIVDESDPNNMSLYRIETAQPLRAVTSGQQCAIYLGPTGLVCLGGGTIERSGPTYHDLGIPTTATNDELQLHPAGHNDLSVLQRR